MGLPCPQFSKTSFTTPAGARNVLLEGLGSLASTVAAATVLASDPNPSSKTLRAPAGVVKDVLENWGQGRPTYDPAKIQAPTLIVVGEWDHETTPEQGCEVFARLEASNRANTSHPCSGVVS